LPDDTPSANEDRTPGEEVSIGTNPGEINHGSGPIPLFSADRGNLGGEVVKGIYGSHVVKRSLYPWDTYYGDISLADFINQVSQADITWTRLDGSIMPQDLVFMDTETTGLAGGTGTVAFLIGIGYITEGGLQIEQHIMRDYDEESAMLHDVVEVLRRHRVLVTFNGKSFDWPLLECRLIFSRIRPINWDDLHIDLLHPARRLWGKKLDSCSLISIERHILGRFREGDIAGADIPAVYFDYLNSRIPDNMLKVIDHNKWDIAAMAAMYVHICSLYNQSELLCSDYELFGMARDFERLRRFDDAIRCYNACIEKSKSVPLTHDAKKRLSYLLKREQRSKEAFALWEDLARQEGDFIIFPFIEMAKYLEHKAKDYQRALDCTEKALKRAEQAQRLSGGGRDGVYGNLRQEILYRRQRLLKRLERDDRKWGS